MLCFFPCIRVFFTQKTVSQTECQQPLGRVLRYYPPQGLAAADNRPLTAKKRTNDGEQQKTALFLCDLAALALFLAVWLFGGLYRYSHAVDYTPVHMAYAVFALGFVLLRTVGAKRKMRHIVLLPMALSLLLSAGSYLYYHWNKPQDWTFLLFSSATLYLLTGIYAFSALLYLARKLAERLGAGGGDEAGGKDEVPSRRNGQKAA